MIINLYIYLYGFPNYLTWLLQLYAVVLSLTNSIWWFLSVTLRVTHYQEQLIVLQLLHDAPEVEDTFVL